MWTFGMETIYERRARASHQAFLARARQRNWKFCRKDRWNQVSGMFLFW
jgi:2-keto-3-deoxy-galactonokinase